MSNDPKYYHPGQTFMLESGRVMENLRIAYHTYGELNASGDNVIWICHALTANSNVTEWWSGLAGTGSPFDPNKHFIVCANILASCYGTSADGLFPEAELPAFVTIRDMVQVHILLRKHLGIEQIRILAGGSMGGYQSLEWCLAEPEVIKSHFMLVTGAAESAWGIAIHTAQRLAIEADSTWLEPNGGSRGLKAARAIGMITYRSYKQFVLTQSDDTAKLDHFKASSYIDYQGDKLVKRFKAKSYWSLTKSMDSHNISRGRGGDIGEVLATIRQRTLVIGINSDLLCPTQEQQVLASYLPDCQLHIIDSIYGHDGFLTETKKIGRILEEWMR